LSNCRQIVQYDGDLGMARTVMTPESGQGAAVECLGLVELSLPVEQGGEGRGVSGDSRVAAGEGPAGANRRECSSAPGLRWSA
jgi:hypothetical protein